MSAMARRGFFAELEYQSRMAARAREGAKREAVRKHAAAVRQDEQTKKAWERAKTQLAKTADSERKRTGGIIRDRPRFSVPTL